MLDLTEYRAIVESLQYLLLSRPDIAYVVNRLSQFMHQPTSEHWSCVKRLSCYVSDTINDGLQIYCNSSYNLHAFPDADWGGNKDVFFIYKRIYCLSRQESSLLEF